MSPDYTRSVPAVMEDTTRMLTRHVGNLDIFHQVQDRSAVSYDWGKKRAPATPPRLSTVARVWSRTPSAA
jgi:hypothetical protein